MPEADAPGLPSVSCSEGDPIGPRIQQAVAAQGLLWILGEDGSLRSLDVDTARSATHLRGERVLSLHRTTGGALWVLADQSGKSGGTVAVRARIPLSHGSEAWENVRATVAMAGTAWAWLTEVDGDPLVLTPVALFDFRRAEVRRLALTHALRPSVQPSPALVGRTVYVGADLGEWGGGLRAVSVETGEVSTIGSPPRDAATDCFDLLNEACHPVTSVVADPADAGCALAAVGLRHMGMSIGRVVRACGDAVAEAAVWPEGGAGGAEAVYSLLATRGAVADGTVRGGVWAATSRGLRRTDDSARTLLPYGRFVTICGVRLARPTPGVVVIASNVHQSVAVVGGTPILVDDPSTSRGIAQ